MLKNRVVRAVGAMSGTSLDGIDTAELLTDGQTIRGFGDHSYRAYTEAERATLKAALGQWPEAVSPDVVELIETTHAAALKPYDLADVIGFHGQTLAHDPSNRGTHQAGDGQILAEVLQKPVVWDFRSADVELGGQGAPLAPFFHFALAKYLQEDEPLAHAQERLAKLEQVSGEPSDSVEFGSLVKLNTGTLLVATSFQTVELDGEKVTGISTAAPIYEKMQGLKKGAEFHLTGHPQEYIILDIE